jgi:hypothetical protein
MSNLPLQLPLSQMQTRWASILNPVIATPIVNGLQLSNVKLTSGTNVLNHTLARVMQGWFLVDNETTATVYRPSTAPFNDLTLTLVASGATTISLWVY